jgi:predicted aldo/keto reductase-like oxidoreductase
MAVVKEYQKAGKVRFIGFSTHAPATVIEETIETGLFDYVNLHYQVRCTPSNLLQ